MIQQGKACRTRRLQEERERRPLVKSEACIQPNTRPSDLLQGSVGSGVGRSKNLDMSRLGAVEDVATIQWNSLATSR